MTSNSPVDAQTLVAAERLYRHVALFDLVRDVRVGLNLAFYRTFAVPRIAELLAHTGEMQANPNKRSMDTGLFMYELIEAGYNSDRGQQVVSTLNKMHRRWTIADEDYLYVLTTFIVVPSRWLATYGPRALTDAENAAATTFYRELGRRMNIPNLPVTYSDAEAIFDDYEARNVGYSDAGRQLMKATENVMAEQLPGPLKPGATLLTRLILDDYVAKAVGLQPAPLAGRLLMKGVSMVRRALSTRHKPRTASWFEPGRKVEDVYPNGYQFDELGP